MARQVVFEHGDEDLGEDAIDGMADLIAEAEVDGWDGEHAFDAAIEDPPHPHWKESIDDLGEDE